MAKQLQLFDLSKYSPRKTASETDFKKCFNELLTSFSEAFDYAFRKMREEWSRLEPSEINVRWPSSTINRYVYSFLAKNEKTLPFLKRKNNTFYIVKDDYMLTFKKVNNCYKPLYNPTKQSEQFERNLTSSNDDNSIIFIGYRVDSTWSQLLGTYAISRNKTIQYWRINLEEHVQKTIQIPLLKPQTPFHEHIQEPLIEPVVKLKIRKEVSKKAK